MAVISKDEQIELLANALGDIAKQAMIIVPDAELTGPELLMVAGNISEYIQHLNDQIAQAEYYRECISCDWHGDFEECPFADDFGGKETKSICPKCGGDVQRKP